MKLLLLIILLLPAKSLAKCEPETLVEDLRNLSFCQSFSGLNTCHQLFTQLGNRIAIQSQQSAHRRAQRLFVRSNPTVFNELRDRLSQSLLQEYRQAGGLKPITALGINQEEYYKKVFDNAAQKLIEGMPDSGQGLISASVVPDREFGTRISYKSMGAKLEQLLTNVTMDSNRNRAAFDDVRGTRIFKAVSDRFDKMVLGAIFESQYGPEGVRSPWPQRSPRTKSTRLIPRRGFGPALTASLALGPLVGAAVFIGTEVASATPISCGSMGNSQYVDYELTGDGCIPITKVTGQVTNFLSGKAEEIQEILDNNPSLCVHYNEIRKSQLNTPKIKSLTCRSRSLTLESLSDEGEKSEVRVMMRDGRTVSQINIKARGGEGPINEIFQFERGGSLLPRRSLSSYHQRSQDYYNKLKLYILDAVDCCATTNGAEKVRCLNHYNGLVPKSIEVKDDSNQSASS